METKITFSKWCISGLVHDCRCNRCLTKQGEEITPETELAAKERSIIETHKFQEQQLKWIKEHTFQEQQLKWIKEHTL